MTYQQQPANPQILSIGQIGIPATITTLYTVPLRSRTILQYIDVVNTNATATTFDIYLVVQNGTAGTSNALFYQQTLQPKQNLQWTGQQVLDSQQTIQVLASATGITTIMSGVTYGYY